MSTDATQGPVFTAIVQKVTDALAPVDLELEDDSASHAGHRGMAGRKAVEVSSCLISCCVQGVVGAMNSAHPLDARVFLCVLTWWTTYTVKFYCACRSLCTEKAACPSCLTI